MGLFSTITGDALIGLGGSLLGNIFGFGNQKSANETNLQIAQMNNEFNERMLERQLQYNTEMFGKQTAYDQKKMQQQNAFTRDMWNANNAYNTAAQQRKRLEEAGLNPYLMMNGGSAGIAGSTVNSGSGGAPSAQGINPPTATPVQVQPYKPDMSGFAGIIQTLLDVQAQKKVRDAQAGNLEAGTEGIRIENKYKVPQILAKLENMQWDNVVKASQERMNNMSFARMGAMFSSDVERAEREAQNAQFTGELIRAQTAYQQMQGLLTSKEIAVFGERFLQEMAVMAAQQASLVEQGKMYKAQAEQAIENALNIKTQRYGIHVDNYIKDRTKRAIIKTAWNNTEVSKYEVKSLQKTIRQQGADYWNPFRYVGTLLTGAGSAMIRR